ncbi:MAG: ribulose-phosphate 3-epimerase [Oscillospiraceae bacterium]|nr:ribulose-phosphate 3-epimerase [Oscillospiraceae bacterium]
MNIKTSASLLAADLSDLRRETAHCIDAGVDWIHFDVMDGQFVEQITYGAPVLKRLKPHCSLPLDVHLMVDNPARQIEFFAEAGADLITIHIESNCDPAACLKRIRELGMRSSLAVKPNTPVESVYEYLPLCDMILVMTVEPGYGGQGFIPEMMPKVKKLREYADSHRFQNLDIQVDGGINTKTAESAKSAGANILVAGTGLFKADDMKAENSALKGLSK